MSDLNKISHFDIHSHSEYSNIRLIDSINRPKGMMKKAYELGYSGITLTDHECLCGHFKWLKTEKELKEKEIIPQDFKCGLGNEIYLVDDRTNITRYWHYILIAKNNNGHRALRELSSIAWYNSFNSRGMTRVPTEKKELEKIVEKYPNSLIATTACIGGELGGLIMKFNELKKDNISDELNSYTKLIDEFLLWNRELFKDDFYIEIAAGTSKDQIEFNRTVIKFAKRLNIKMVIGSDAHYLTEKERPIHKAYLNSKDGDREVDDFYYDAHFMTKEEIINNLHKSDYSTDIVYDCFINSMEIYNKIESYNLESSSIIPEIEVKSYPKNRYNYINYPVINELLSSDDIQERYWINYCIDSLKEKNLENETYLARIETEADIIKDIGNKLNDCLFKYFNTYQHYIDLFWECGSIVGPGRGSSVCFLSNYLMGITQLDPIVWDLKEWRFLNKERVELPKLNIGQYKIGEHIQWCA